MGLIRTSQRVTGLALFRLDGRFATKSRFFGTTFLFHQRSALRFESVDHRQVSELTGDTHCLNRLRGTMLCVHSTTLGTTK